MEPEDALRRSEALSRAFLASASESIVATDATGRIVLLNARAETMFGYTRAELIGQPVELLIPKRLRERHVAHRATYMAAPRVRSMGQGLDLIGLRKDGSAFPVEVSLSFRADPMKEQALSPSSPTSASAWPCSARRVKPKPDGTGLGRPRTPRHRGCQFRGGEGHGLHPNLPARRLFWLIL